MQEGAEAPAAPSHGVGEAEPEALARALGVDAAVARALLAAGLATPEACRAAPDAELRSAGLTVEDIGRLRADPNGTAASSAASAAIVEKWMRTVRQGERPRRRARAAGATPKGSAEVLRKWVQGDDRALEVWIQSSDGQRPSGGPAPMGGPTGPRPSAPGPVPDLPAPGGGAPASVAPSSLPANLVEREETVVRWLTDLLDRVKSDQFDPTTILQEFQELQRSLYDEREKHRQLEEELEHVKRGSVAVIKYVRTRENQARAQLLEEKDGEIAELRTRLDDLIARVEASQTGRGEPGAVPASDLTRGEFETRLKGELAAKEMEFGEREGELRRRIVELEGEVRTLQATGAASSAPGGDAPRAQDERERELIRRENELRTRFEEIRIRTEETERKREAINFKERELTGREQDIELRQHALEVEGKRVEEAKRAIPADALKGHPEVEAQANRIQSIEEQLQKRELEIREREAFLNQKLGEVEELQKKAVGQEAERLHSEVLADAKTPRVRTGVRRLDDLMFGGVPNGSQVLINGPAHTGKDILARLFMAEGLKNGQGALWVITDRTSGTVREEMSAVYPGYADAEKRGLVRYVDLYSKSLGVNEAEKGVKLIASNDKALLEQLTAAVNAFAAELKEKAGSYRLVFESVSTVTAYLDATTTFRFLQPLIGRRKLDGAAGYYELETGMHSDSDLQTLEHMMDGSIHLKVDQLKTFLSVRGITDVQSRAWVGYTFAKRSFTLGSFSLDHIR